MEVFWLHFNIILFSLYALFGAISFIWPSVIENMWLTLMHIATLLVDLLIVYGLIMRVPRTNYLVTVISLLMFVHLLVFIVAPLSMAVAYIGPSRSFYSLIAVAVSSTMGERYVNVSITVFNAAILFVHGANVCFFSRRKTGELFAPPAG